MVCLGQRLEKGFCCVAKGDMSVDDIELPSVPDDLTDTQPPWDAEVLDEVDMDASLGIQGGPLVPVAFVCPLVQGIYGGGVRGVVALKALLLEGEKVGNPVRPPCHPELLEGDGGVLGVFDGRVVEIEEVDGSLGWRRPGLWGPSTRPWPRKGGGLVPGDFLLGGGRFGGRGGWRPCLLSGGSSPVYLVPLRALISGVMRRNGQALLSSEVGPSGLSGALLPSSRCFWRCHCTQICSPPLGRGSWRRYWIVSSHQIQSPVWLLRRGCWTLLRFRKCGYASGWGGACDQREDDEDAWSRWAEGKVGRVQGLGGCCPAVSSGLLGARGGCASFSSGSLGRDWRW